MEQEKPAGAAEQKVGRWEGGRRGGRKLGNREER